MSKNITSEVQSELLQVLKDGGYFFKHDFGRNKRSRKWVVLSNDGLCLKWKAVGVNEGVGSPRQGAEDSPSSGGKLSARLASPGRKIMKSSSFSRFSSVSLADVSHIIYGPYTDTFVRKSLHDRVDARYTCFSLVLRESRTIDFAAEDETNILPWLLGIQQLITYFTSEGAGDGGIEKWTLPKLQLQKVRLKVAAESDRTGQSPYDVILSAVLDAAQDRQKQNEKATALQAKWKQRFVQNNFKKAVSEMMEINGLVDNLEQRCQQLEEIKTVTAIKIENAMKAAEMEEPPPRMPSEKDMQDPKKMQQYMLEMGEYSARQQLKLAAMEPEVRQNQAATAENARLQKEQDDLKAIRSKLRFDIDTSALKDQDADRVREISRELGVTPRGTIGAKGVREVRLFKETQSTRLGIIFHQNNPLSDADGVVDQTPRNDGGHQSIVLPVIKVLDRSGIAGQCGELHEGDQVLSVNGRAALSNIQAVQMLRDAVGPVVLAVRETNLTARG